MNSTARNFELCDGSDGTQQILNVRLTALIEHMNETKGLYLFGWEIDFIKDMDRKRTSLRYSGFYFATEPAEIICSIYNRLALECRL